MRQLELFAAGERASASKLNLLVEELKRLQNVQGGRRINVVHTAAGVLIDWIDRYLTTDDKYKLDEVYNQSDGILRQADKKLGDLADFLRVRNCVGESPRDEENYLFRAMLMLDRSFGGGGRGGEGGWVTDAGLDGLGLEEGDPTPAVPSPRSIGQLGDVLILDDGDFIATTPHDGDTVCYVNIRHDAHFYLSEGYDGRLYLTTTPPGEEPNGYPIIGEIVGDPRKANAMGELLKESVEWRPQLKLPHYDVPGEIYASPDTINWSFPAQAYVPNSTILAWDFATIGKDRGWSAHYQIDYKIPTYGLGFLIKYCAVNGTGATQYAYFDLEWKAINDLGSLSTLAGITTSDFLIPVPAGSTEDTIRYLWLPFIPETAIVDYELAIIKIFGRDWGNVQDTLTTRLLITEIRMLPMIVVVPP